MTFNLLSIINQDLGPNANYVWIATGYTLAAGVGALVWGRLSDVFGRRWFFIGGNALALLGSILGAAAQNIVTLIFAQVFIGLALPSQLSFSIALAELIPNKWRGYNNALLFFMAVPFSTFGPIIARNFVANTSQGWRWSYYVNLILTGLAIGLAIVFYHPPIFEQLHTRASKRKVIKELDYLGMLLFVAGLILFLLGLRYVRLSICLTYLRHSLTVVILVLIAGVDNCIHGRYVPSSRKPFLLEHSLTCSNLGIECTHSWHVARRHCATRRLFRMGYVLPA